MENTIIETIIKWIIPAMFTGILGWITKELKANKTANNAMKESMVLLLRSQIVSKCDNAIEMGYLPDHVRSCLEDLFNQYEALGGNHGVGHLVNQAFDLPPHKDVGKK